MAKDPFSRNHNQVSETKANVIRRVSFDIGSATTKMVVADVDIQKNRIISVVLKDTRLAGYKNNLQRPGSDGTISDAMLSQGIQALQALKAAAQALNPEPSEFCAVATAAFRTAKNGLDIAQALEKHTNIPIKIINQAEEARLGFQGAVAKTGVDAQYALVWDVGGGSMQMANLDSHKKLEIYESNFAFIPFTQMVIKTIQHKEPDPHGSPNPLTEKEAQEAIDLAYEHAAQLPDFIKHKIMSLPPWSLVLVQSIMLLYRLIWQNPSR